MFRLKSSAPIPRDMGRVYVLARFWYLLLAGASVIASAVALATGPGIRGSLLLLGGGVWCLLVGLALTRKARAAQRHRALRRRRLERERDGLAPPRG
jgi:hypothetical protein